MFLVTGGGQRFFFFFQSMLRTFFNYSLSHMSLHVFFYLLLTITFMCEALNKTGDFVGVKHHLLMVFEPH